MPYVQIVDYLFWIQEEWKMISERMAKMAAGGSAIRAMFEEGKRLAKEYGAENVFDFSIGNPYFAPPEAVKNAIVDIITNEDPMYVHGYPANAGYPEVRKAVADSLNARFGTKYDENNIIMTVGAAGGLFDVMHTLLNPDDEVICISPYFFEYNNYITTPGGKVVVVPASESEGFVPDVEAIAKAITPRTKALVVNSPNNPSGVVYSPETLQAMADLLRRKAAEYGHPIYLISDEPYRELVFQGFTTPWIPNYYDDTLVCYSYSKSLSLPGERIGYILVGEKVALRQEVYAAICGAGRALGYVNAPSLFQRVVAECDGLTSDLAVYQTNRDLLYQGLTKMGYTCVDRKSVV